MEPLPTSDMKNKYITWLLLYFMNKAIIHGHIQKLLMPTSDNVVTEWAFWTHVTFVYISSCLAAAPSVWLAPLVNLMGCLLGNPLHWPNMEGSVTEWTFWTHVTFVYLSSCLAAAPSVLLITPLQCISVLLIFSDFEKEPSLFLLQQNCLNLQSFIEPACTSCNWQLNFLLDWAISLISKHLKDRGSPCLS